MQEMFHMVSVGHESSMFHGTWGYVQLPTKLLLDTLNLSKLNLASYKDTIKNVSQMAINPQLFMPTIADNDHYYSVWMIQIVQVMREYIAKPSHKEGAISTTPPVIKQH